MTSNRTTDAATPPVHDHITDAVKAPALVRLTPNVVLMRFETLKVYAADGAVRHLLGAGVIRPGQTLVDSSSGIYALALAMACHRHGLRCRIVASTTVDDTIRAQLEVLGVTVDQMPPSDDLRLDQNRRVARVHELLAHDPDLHWMRQYHDDVHHLGYAEAADLLRGALPGEPLTVVGSVGTGASTGSSPGRCGSTTRAPCWWACSRSAASRSQRALHRPDAIIAGIGSAIHFDNVHHDLYDRVHWLDFRHAMAATIDLLREHAVFAGLSTGAAHLVARWKAAATPTARTSSSAPTPATATPSGSSPATARRSTPPTSPRSRSPRSTS
ncbi:pyridoxal-phosphate dependent enzyme [Saccharothrix sp. MB29]|nr:pyridoxal-phosphate dependent enzyme [Saccharothrix sp. MB29]